MQNYSKQCKEAEDDHGKKFKNQSCMRVREFEMEMRSEMPKFCSFVV